MMKAVFFLTENLTTVIFKADFCKNSVNLEDKSWQKGKADAGEREWGSFCGSL